MPSHNRPHYPAGYRVPLDEHLTETCAVITIGENGQSALTQSRRRRALISNREAEGYDPPDTEPEGWALP
jgi:hypothetical protein